MKRREAQIQQVKEQLRELKKEERPDKNLDRVIIRQTAKVPDEFLNTSVKHATNQKIIDNQISHPLGLEWNTYQGFHELNKPRADPRRGVIIKPLSFEEGVTAIKLREKNDPLAKQKDEEEEGRLKLSTKEDFDKARVERRFMRRQKDRARIKAMEERIRKESIEHVVTAENQPLKL
jgi:hypothetical protein